MKTIPTLLSLAFLAGCGAGNSEIEDDAEAFSGIADDEVVSLAGTEPFWSVEIEGDEATFSSPENLEGTSFPVERFAGLNGISFSGRLEGESFDAMVTPGDCSDGMSDRTYPYTVTISWGADQLVGCGYTDRQPFSGPEMP
ncbi:COG3650 family protein [Qipengyuania nanhaisediminis]|uniref:Lipoprotein n=1 Tax=Qipengyuania nanhaisediminis TaxID=604088 RepID=A0A1I5LCG5_9SPHN|nr:hypothetical protein [Qipengyuania nanhaisediminis]SFO94556.1 hypothetical protein SAMN04488060_0887 [Qipengyuania nanhaisediminis]